MIYSLICYSCIDMCALNTEENKKTELFVAFKAKATTGEAAIWHPDRQTLFWVDIEGKTLYEYIPDKADCLTWEFDRMITTVVPETQSTVIVALQDEIIHLDLETNKRTSIAFINVVDRSSRCNDGKCDPAGRFWVGTIAKKAPKGTAALYMVLRDGTVIPKLRGLTNSNGIVWTADKKYMYHNDSPTVRIARYTYDNETGNIRYDGIAVEIPEGTGHPDGMTIDENGNLWVAQWKGAGVYCYDPRTGKPLTKIDIPAPHVSSCAFGGKELDTLYITTARSGLTPEQLKEYPLSGSLFACKPGVIGVVANRFTK